MISTSFYFQLIGRVLLLTILAFVLTWCWFYGYLYLMIPMGLVLLFQMAAFVHYFNQTNRKIAHLFESIKNEDFTLRFPEGAPLNSFKKLNRSLNRVNDLIRTTHTTQQVQEKYYQEILQAATIGIFTINSKGHILFANATARKTFNLEQLNHIRQLERMDPKLYAALKERQAFNKQAFQFSNEREKIQLLVNATTMVLNQEQILLVVIQNIKEELDHKETESWSKLIRVMTHEIMNTIAPITSVSESILKHYFSEAGDFSSPDSPKASSQKIFQALQIIKEQSHGLTTFVQAYRSLLNIPKPNKTIVQVPKVLEKVRLMMAKDLQSQQIRLDTTNSGQAFEIFADEQQLIQVLINVIKNACQALAHTQEGVIKISFRENARKQKFLQISDNGPGIPSEIIEQIFIPFFTTKEDGTGTGLPLSKQIMSLHGGRIEVHSPAYSGAVFTLFF